MDNHICKDQSYAAKANAKKRGQARRIRSAYASASRLLACLGEASSDSDSVTDILLKVDKQCLVHNPRPLSRIAKRARHEHRGGFRHLIRSLGSCH